MANIDSIVSVTVQVGASAPSQRGFGVPLILGYHTRFTENVKTYNRLSELITDGFTVNDPVYMMASRFFAQTPRVERLKVGRLPAPGSAQTTTISVGLLQNQTGTFTVISPDGTRTAVSQAFDTDAATTATALAATLNSITNLSATTSGNTVTATADNNGELFFFDDVTGLIGFLDTTGDWAYDTQLNTILNEDSDFYTVCIDVNSAANVADVAAWAASNQRIALFGPQSNNPASYNGAAADALASGTNNRAASVIVRSARSSFKECAWLGEVLPFPPGSQTWSLKQPVGATADNWTSSDITEIETSNSNYLTRIAGLTLIRNGQAHGGQFLDITRGIDWLTARMQERILAALANNRKVPYTDGGAQVFVSEVRAQLLQGEEAGLLAPGTSTVTITPVADQSAPDRAARILRGLEFQTTLAGAVHQVRIIGTVSV